MISIIGAGPIGLYTAYLLAKTGEKVQVFEKNKKIGYPIQCTGLVTKQIENLIKIPESIILNKVKKVRINSPSISTLIKLKQPEYILDRAKFDQFLAKKAKNAGAKIYLNHKFTKLKGNRVIIQTKKGKKSFPSEIIIGADGPNSKIAKIINKTKPKYNIGMQARTKLKHPNSFYEVFIGKDKGDFAWIVPETNQISRIGMITKNNKHFQKFIKGQKAKVLSYPSGPIPIYKKLKIQKKNLYIVGDAATTIKNTTGGGIYFGLSSAKVLANSIRNKKNYTKEFKKHIKPSLNHHNLTYKILKTFNDKDFDKMVHLCSQEKIKKILESADREHPINALIKMILKEPKFLLFSKNLIKFIKNK